MASTSYLSRVIFKEHTGDDTTIDIAGEYNLLIRAKSISSPVSAPNVVESTTTEDAAQTYEAGIQTTDKREVKGNLEKKYLQAINNLKGKRIDVINLYGTDGIGGVAKYAYVGQVVAAPDDVGGTDEILGMTAWIIPNTVSVECTDEITVKDNNNGTFTVAKATQETNAEEETV